MCMVSVQNASQNKLFDSIDALVRSVAGLEVYKHDSFHAPDLSCSIYTGFQIIHVKGPEGKLDLHLFRQVRLENMTKKQGKRWQALWRYSPAQALTQAVEWEYSLEVMSIDLLTPLEAGCYEVPNVNPLSEMVLHAHYMERFRAALAAISGSGYRTET